MVYGRQTNIKMLSFSSHIKRSDFHFSGPQRVAIVALKVIPHHTISIRKCEGVVAGAVVDAVQVGIMTVLEPPATFACSCTRSA